MWKFILVAMFCLLLSPLVAMAEVKDHVSSTPLDGFWGMKFGESKAACRKELASKLVVSIDESFCDEKRITTNSCTFGGRNAECILLNFVDDKLYDAAVIFVPEEEKANGLFNELKSELDKKYFVGESIREFKEPYRDGDDYEMQAVKLGKANIKSVWDIARKDAINKNTITLSLTAMDKKIKVILLYYDGVLFRQAMEGDEHQNPEVKDHGNVAILDGFWGMKFGDSKATCRKVLAEKSGVSIDEANIEDDLISIKSCTFGGRKVDFIMLGFIDDKFYHAMAAFKPDLEAKAQDFFDSLKAELDKKYFVGESIREFKEPYKDGDGYEMQAVRLGKADIKAVWHFALKNSTDQNFINMHLSASGDNIYIALSYTDGVLFDKAMAKEKHENSKDF